MSGLCAVVRRPWERGRAAAGAREQRMVTLLKVDGFKFYFWTQENFEPPHFHVSKGGGSAKYFLDPLKEAWVKGMSDEDKARMAELASANASKWLDEWKRVMSR